MTYNESYTLGFHNGHLDRLLGIHLYVALTSNIPGYADGYSDGQLYKESF